MICPQCHAVNREGDRFCEQCGSPLNTSMEQPFGGQSDLAATVMAAPPGASILVRLNGDGEQQTYQLGTRVVIGRLDSCDIPIHDKSVSREHARLSRLRDGYVVEDLGSTNGTLVNGKRIDEATLLHAGDSVTIGAIEFRFEHERPKREEVPLPIESPWDSPAQGQGDEYPFPREGAPIFEAPTIRDLPTSTPFPPMEPFAPAPAPDSTVPGVSAEGSEQLDAMKAALGFGAQPGTEPAGGTPTPPTEEPAPAAPFPDRTVAESSPWAPPPSAPAPAEPPVSAAPQALPESAPTSSTPGTDDELVNEAQAVAYRLTEMISELTARLQDSRADSARAQESLQGLQASSHANDAIRQTLQALPPPSLTDADLSAMRETVDSLAQNPRDVEVLMRVAQNSAMIATILEDYARLRQAVQSIAGAMGDR